MNMIWLLLFPLIVIGCSADNNAANHSGRVQQILHEMPETDRDDLDAFFSGQVMNWAAYTLFGNKSMSFGCYSELAHVMHPFYMCDVECAIIYGRGWDMWTIYASKFPSEIYSLRRIRILDPHWHLFLINKPATIRAIQKNLTSLSRCFGCGFNR